MQFLELNWFEHGLRVVMAWICSLLYPLISWIYELFMYLSKVNLLENTMVKPIYQRVTVILSIVMVFYVTFEFVKYIIQPDNITDKEKGAGKLIYKLIAVILLIAFVPNIFGWGYEVQRIVVEQNIIGKLINGHQKVDGVSEGRNFASNMLANFYKKTSSNMNCEEAGITCGDLVDYNIISLQTYGNLPFLTMGLKETYEVSNQNDLGTKVEQPAIYFNGLFAVLVGGFVFYILVLYCIDVGARWAQLIFLQVIAPIPIIGFLAPAKDGIFQKWTKQCLTTYLDIFIRVAIINYVILLSGSLLNPENLRNFINLEGASEEIKVFITLVLVMGLLMFAQKAPKLLGELFPKMGAASGNFGLSGKARGLDKLGRVAGAAVSGAAGTLAGTATGIAQGIRRARALKNDGSGQSKGFLGGAWGATKGAIGGAVGGAARGIYHGAQKGNVFKNMQKGIQGQIQANQRFGNRQENGYTLGHQIEDRARGMFGLDSRTQNIEKSKAPIAQENETLKKVENTRKQIEERALSKISDGKGGIAAQKYAQASQRLKDLQENQAYRDKNFRVGKYASTDAATARKAYENDVALAKASVNKDNFVDYRTGKFNSAAYNQACEAAAAKVKVDDYTIAYRTQSDADAAIVAAGKAKGIERSKYSTDEAYNQALLSAGINKDMYIVGFETQDKAEEALAEAIKEQQKKVDEEKDKAVAEYVATSGDGAIDSMLAELNTHVTEYNKTASTEDDRRITYNDGSAGADDIDATKIKSDFSAFSDMVKGKPYIPNNFKDRQNANEQELISKNAEIERIKHETEGSGINDGKK